MSVYAYIVIIICAIIGNSIYGGFGALAILILGILYYCAIGLSVFPPVVGIFAQALVMYYGIFPFVHDTWGIYPTLLTHAMFGTSIAAGVFYTLMWLIAFDRQWSVS